MEDVLSLMEEFKYLKVLFMNEGINRRLLALTQAVYGSVMVKRDEPVGQGSTSSGYRPETEDLETIEFQP